MTFCKLNIILLAYNNLNYNFKVLNFYPPTPHLLTTLLSDNRLHKYRSNKENCQINYQQSLSSLVAEHSLSKRKVGGSNPP